LPFSRGTAIGFHQSYQIFLPLKGTRRAARGENLMRKNVQKIRNGNAVKGKLLKMVSFSLG
jgi:hypothetical protein